MPPDSKLPIVDSFAAEYLEYYQILPLELRDGKLRVAVAGEPDADTLYDLAETFGAPVELVEAEPGDLLAAIHKLYSSATSVVELVRDLDGRVSGDASDPGGLLDARDLANHPPVIRFVNLLVREAHELGASDIHLDATNRGVRVRIRVDGVLTELPPPPAALQHAIVSRIKLLSQLDIANRRTPQDGRVRLRLEERELDLRVSTVPTLFGESVVLRLLEQGGRPVGLDELGLGAAQLDAFRRLAARPHGIVLATGPTGSGKTTTLYAALSLRNSTHEKIVTVEDPVEYQLAGITQVPVEGKTGVTFAAALRSILRQDPDVLMVGEMRDRDTAAVAVQAAMTGHLVFSTLHTNDAASALTRLDDLGIESYLVAATVEAVLAQRLVRRVCTACAETYSPDPAVVAMLSGRTVNATEFMRGAGCSRCRGTGFRGRVGLFELLVMEEPVRAAVLARAPVSTVRQLAIESGMVPLRSDGWAKAAAGMTTVEEVLRVAQI